MSTKNKQETFPTSSKTNAAPFPHTFDELKRNAEYALVNDPNNAAPLLDLSTVIVKACLNKCLDPQRKIAAERDTISNNGINPALLALKKSIDHDRRTLDNTTDAANAAYALEYDVNGDLIQTITDTAAAERLTALQSETIGDAQDLVNTAAAAILEQFAAHYNGQENFLDWTYTTRRLSKKVYIQAAESAAYRETETTPIQEVYREVRRAIMASRAVQTDPRNGYLYIEDMTENGLETIYRRMGKHMDIGGCIASGSYDAYTADAQSVADYDSIIQALELTDRQLTIVTLRMRGYGLKAIAKYLGVTREAVRNALKKIQAKATAIGYAPKE